LINREFIIAHHSTCAYTCLGLRSRYEQLNSKILRPHRERFNSSILLTGSKSSMTFHSWEQKFPVIFTHGSESSMWFSLLGAKVPYFHSRAFMVYLRQYCGALLLPNSRTSQLKAAHSITVRQFGAKCRRWDIRRTTW